MLDWISPDIISFTAFVGLVIAAAAFGGQWGAGPWYDALSKPAWTPPNWLFPIAWTLLYLMIALAGWMIWEAPGEGHTLLLTIWSAQLVLNAIWSYLFFGCKEIGLAFFDIVALWLLIAVFILLAWPVAPHASMLFIPYLLWITYAAALNGAIRRRNPVRMPH